jgi:hypothetical protein
MSSPTNGRSLRYDDYDHVPDLQLTLSRLIESTGKLTENFNESVEASVTAIQELSDFSVRLRLLVIPLGPHR